MLPPKQNLYQSYVIKFDHDSFIKLFKSATVRYDFTVAYNMHSSSWLLPRKSTAFVVKYFKTMHICSNNDISINVF